ncbi:hypothetical protein QZH41_002823 [Actinostola sp. cb2023]|nr:hypothetical protein QZH41_002823 [Actinostola sp. cb2023]
MPAQIQGITPPNKLEVLDRDKLVENWKTFKQMWQNYAVITNMRAQTEEYRIVLFLHCIGPDALRIYNGFDFATEEEQKSLENVIQKFDQYAIGELNETYERFQFNDRNQKPGESIDSYVTALRNQSKTCNFCKCMNESLIRDRIVCGIQNPKTRQRLLQERKLDIKKCIDICRSAETAAAQLKVISGTTTSSDVHKVRFENPNKRPWRQKYERNDRNAESEKIIKCKFCGGEHLASREKCPAWGEKCRKCKGLNHFSRVCRSNSRNVRGVYEDHETDESDVEIVSGVSELCDSIHAVQQCGFQKEIYVEMLIDEKSVTFQVDSGSSINIIPEKYAGERPIIPTQRRLRMWNGAEMNPVGTTRLIVRNPKDRKKYSLEFIVVKESLTPLIGARAAQHMQLITVNADKFVTASNVKSVKETSEVKRLTTVEQLLEEYSDVLNRQLGTLPGKVHLEVDKDVKPVVTPVRRVPTALTAKLKTELDKYVELGVLAPIEEPTPWVSSLVVATKKSGALRVCIDPRELNKALKRETYQLPILDEILPELAQAKVFSTVDLRSGFWHCVLDEESIKVQSDHKPLEAILKKPLSRAPQRLQGMMMRLQRYVVEVHYERGTNMLIADMLSRAYLTEPDFKGQAEFEQINMAKFLPITDQRLKEIRQETNRDDTLQVLSAV